MEKRILHHIRIDVAPVKSNLVKWGNIVDDDVGCKCGEVGNVKHLLICGLSSLECIFDDLWLVFGPKGCSARIWKGKYKASSRHVF